jgi:hypothetical protein
VLPLKSSIALTLTLDGTVLAAVAAGARPPIHRVVDAVLTALVSAYRRSVALSTGAAAETVDVNYRGPVDLKPFTCTATASSFVHRVCFDEKNRYVLVRLKETYYHHCAVVAETARAGSRQAVRVGSTTAPSKANSIAAPIRCRRIERQQSAPPATLVATSTTRLAISTTLTRVSESMRMRRERRRAKRYQRPSAETLFMTISQSLNANLMQADVRLNRVATKLAPAEIG